MTIRGIDHVGVTVPSIEQATEFFVRALGARIDRQIERAAPRPEEGRA